jgi:hypothetical protein
MRGAAADAALVSLVLAIGPLVVSACRTPCPPASLPGLGEIMTLTQMRHMKLWFAGDAENWPLADYELDELEEGLADAVRFHPTHKDAPRPLTELVPEFTALPIRKLRAAVANRDPASFAAAYDALTAACNGCHGATGFSFNVVTRPTANPYANQKFRPGS